VVTVAHPQQMELALGGERVVLSSNEVFSYADVPGEPLRARRVPNDDHSEEMRLHNELPVGLEYIVGWRQRRGKGSIIVLGLPPSTDLVLAVHRWLDVAIPSRARSPHVTTALFEREGTYSLIAANNGGESRDAVVELAADTLKRRHWIARDLFSGEAAPLIEGRCWLRLPRKSGTVLTLELERG
jgi:hypothetical protein